MVARVTFEMIRSRNRSNCLLLVYISFSLLMGWIFMGWIIWTQNHLPGGLRSVRGTTASLTEHAIVGDLTLQSFDVMIGVLAKYFRATGTAAEKHFPSGNFHAYGPSRRFFRQTGRTHDQVSGFLKVSGRVLIEQIDAPLATKKILPAFVRAFCPSIRTNAQPYQRTTTSGTNGSDNLFSGAWDISCHCIGLFLFHSFQRNRKILFSWEIVPSRNWTGTAICFSCIHRFLRLTPFPLLFCPNQRIFS